MEKMIWFDLDGTIADLYGVERWLEDLRTENVRPYREARPLVNMSALARVLHTAQKRGYKIGVVSWTSKGGSGSYAIMTKAAKRDWLKKHLPSVKWDRVDIITYGTPKHRGRRGILFDDEEANREAWGEGAYGVDNIIQTIRGLT